MSMDTPPSILFMNRSYWPDAEATGQLLTELAQGLASRFDVAALVGHPNANLEAGDYRHIRHRAGVRIRRVWHTRFNKRRMLGRLCNMASYLLSAAPSALLGRRPDVIVVETDPPLLCLIGAMVQRLRGSRLVVYLQDINPDVAFALGKFRNRGPIRWLRSLFFRTYRKADSIVVLSEDMKSLLIEEGVAPERIHCIPNWVDVEQVHPVKQDNPLRAQLKAQDKFVVMYSGNMGLTQRLETMLDAAGELASDPRFLFVLMGRGATRASLEALVKDRGLTNVRFLDYYPKDQLAISLSAADVHLVPLDPKLSRLLMPSKLYGILASGTPVCAMTSPDCELARIVTGEKVGTVTPAGDVAALVKALLDMAGQPAELAAMGQRARGLAIEQYAHDKCIARFGDMLEQVLNNTNTHRQPAWQQATAGHLPSDSQLPQIEPAPRS